MTQPYAASDIISILDASLLWFDKDPREQVQGYGDYGWIVLLTRDREVHDLACTLLSEIKQGSITPRAKSWLRDTPPSWKSRLESLPGSLDPQSTKIEIGELIRFASRRGQQPEFLAHLMTVPNTLDGTTLKKNVHRPQRERAERAIKALYPNDVPDQASEPNQRLLKKVDGWLRDQKLPDVKNDTILRAAGRRK